LGIFNHDDKQDARLDELERQMRRVVEEVQQLSIDLGVTRMELLRARTDLEGTVQKSSVDPALISLNETVTATRKKLKEAKGSSEQQWDAIREEVDAQLNQLRTSLDEALSDSNASGSSSSGASADK
jgi:chromosome segregation ATPase